MLVFPKEHFKDHMLSGAPAASIGGANPTGWSNENLFIDYIKHFIACEKPCKEDPALLILDNHESHLSVTAINVAKKKMGLSCLHCLPIHHISYSLWTSLSLVHIKHIIMPALMTGCSQTQANLQPFKMLHVLVERYSPNAILKKGLM
jgi:hypothetical protein